MPETAQYLYEVGIFGGTDAAPHTQRFPARGVIFEEGWIRFQDTDGNVVFYAQQNAVAFVRRHDTTVG